jgi:2-polyprenyl-3-methyl-5-hydroxy-6-metoxy-1,4-benzoquinol methylase
MLLPDLSKRVRQPELMDDPALDRNLHWQALQDLERINRISGISDLLWRILRPLCREITHRPVRVLDVGCGGGDIGVAIWRKAARTGYKLQIGGCDVSHYALRVAAERAETAGAEAVYFPVDVLSDPLPDDWDVLFCSLFLHHFDETQGVRVLANMGRSARKLVLVDDLVRGRLGYLLCWWGVRMLTRSPIVHVDGPLSVRSGFRICELVAMAELAELRGARFTRHWPERLLLAWRRPE